MDEIEHFYLIAERRGTTSHNHRMFTDVIYNFGQVGAIMSGVQQGLTMVVGPPGTGKTDTAVQIMHVLYHNQPEQRTLLITHSNQVRPPL